MNISLTKQELVMLLRVVYIGDWVMFADIEGEACNAPEVLAHKKVLQKLFSTSSRAKLEGIAEYDKESGEYFETGAFEEDCHVFIDEWEEGRFWEIMADRLAQRDLLEQVGEEAFKAMDRVERGGKLCELAAKYEDEFVEHGLERLQLLNTTGKGET